MAPFSLIRLRVRPRVAVRVLLAALLWVVAVSVVPVAEAATTPSLEGLSVRPVDAAGQPLAGPFFKVSRNPGSRFVGNVELRNSGKRTIAVRVAAVDATTSDTGGTAFLDRAAPREDTGAWITPSTGALTLQPGDRVLVRFDVRIPADAVPGDHVGGLVVEPERRARIEGDADSRRVLRVITAVQVRVRGRAAQDLTVARPRLTRDGDTPVLTVRLANDGDLLCRPILTAVLRKEGGGDVLSSERREVDTILPGTAIDYVLRWGRKVKDARYDVQVRTEGCGAPAAADEALTLGRAGSNGDGATADGAADPGAGGGGTSAAQLAGFAGALVLVAALGWGLARRLPRRGRDDPDA